MDTAVEDAMNTEQTRQQCSQASSIDGVWVGRRHRLGGVICFAAAFWLAYLLGFGFVFGTGAAMRVSPPLSPETVRN